MTIRHYGKSGYQKLLRQNIQCAQYMHQLVSSSGDFAAMHKPELFIFSFRFFPARLRKNQSKEVDQEFDRLNQKNGRWDHGLGLRFYHDHEGERPCGVAAFNLFSPDHIKRYGRGVCKVAENREWFVNLKIWRFEDGGQMLLVFFTNFRISIFNFQIFKL